MSDDNVQIVCLQVPVFCIGTEKEGATKPLEEASEALEKWKALKAAEDLDDNDTLKWMADDLRTELADELFDTIQASVNLAMRNGLNLHDAAKRVTRANVLRNRLPPYVPLFAMVGTGMEGGGAHDQS